MTETFTVISERVDDVPLLLSHLQRMGVQVRLDEHVILHGNWQGLSLGWVVECWLSHILSQADHRLNHVQAWAERRLKTLCGCTGQSVRALDFSDDRLGDVLCALSDDEVWEPFERSLNQDLLRVYDLFPERVRLDSTSASGCWNVTEDGLFQFGHSKDHRPDLPQIKVMMASLDPLGLPVATQVVSGNRADDPLYIPAIEQVRAGLDRRGLLYVGDCKMAALGTRAFTQAGEDFYLCPLSNLQVSDAALSAYLRPVLEDKQSLTPLFRQQGDGRPLQIAEGYECQEEVTATVEGQEITWTERRLVVRSLKGQEAATEALKSRLFKAQTALSALNQRGRGKKRFQDLASLQAAAEAIVKRDRVEGLLKLAYEEDIQQRTLRQYRDRPARIEIHREVRVQAHVDEEALNRAIQKLGWRVYATNAKAERLPLSEAILAYRESYLIERGFGRLKGQPLSLTPMYLQREDRATGLIRLLSIGLKAVTLLEFVVRRRLGEEKEKLAGLYAGNPKRATDHPTAEQLLEAFQEITLTVIQEPHQTRRHLTSLSNLQQRILALLDFPINSYTRLYAVSCKPP